MVENSNTIKRDLLICLGLGAVAALALVIFSLYAFYNPEIHQY
jgi:hypothetical protein